VEDGHPRISFGGMDIRGRSHASASPAGAKGGVEGRQAITGRTSAERDTLRVYWKGKRLTVLTIPGDTGSITFKIDTAWKDDGGIPWNPRIAYGSLLDARDGQTYRTVEIGARTWMAENLNHTVKLPLNSDGSTPKPYLPPSLMYDNNADSAKRYGMMYPWNGAMNLPDSCHNKVCAPDSHSRRGICPSGWSVPKGSQWDSVMNLAGGLEHAGTVLRSQSGWKGTFNTDSLGLRLLPSGYRDDLKKSYSTSGYAGFWCSEENSATLACQRYSYVNNTWFGGDIYDKTFYYSLRCLKDTP
jgi:uncharacterized protein (TIGR02145 family)